MSNAFNMGGGNIAVSVSQAEVAEIEQTLDGIANGATTAIRAAINDTLRAGRTILARMAKEVLNLPYGEILDRISIKQLATADNLVGVLRIDYGPVSLREFKAKFSRAVGVTVTTIREEGAEVFKHMFRATMASGHTAIFENEAYVPKAVPTEGSYTLAARQARQAAAGRKHPHKLQAVVARKIIQETYGPSVVAVFEHSEDLVEEALSGLNDKFHQRLASKIDWQLAKAGRLPTEDTSSNP